MQVTVVSYIGGGGGRGRLTTRPTALGARTVCGPSATHA